MLTKISGERIKELFVRMHTEDEKAWTEFYNETWRWMFGIARRWVQNYQDCEDIAAQTMIQLYQRRHKLLDYRNPFGLITVIIYCFCMNLKRKEYQFSYCLIDFIEELPDNVILNDPIITNDEIEVAIDNLPSKEKLLLNAKIAKLSNNEFLIRDVAASIGIHYKGVSNYLHQARNRLRKEFDRKIRRRI